MAFCPKCRGEYVSSVTRCPTCEVDLVQSLGADALEDRRVLLNAAVGDGKALAVAQGSFEAMCEMADILEASSVTCRVIKPETNCEHEGGHPCNHYRLVIVKEDEVAAAIALKGRYQEMLEREGMPAAAPEPGDKCPACGTEVPQDAAECPECGIAFG